MSEMPPLASRFADNKAEGAMRTIGEVAQATGIKAHVLRYWEQQFPMLRPLKRSGGRRLYRSEDVALVEQIDRLVNHDGYTLKGARAALESKGDDSPGRAVSLVQDKAASASKPGEDEILWQLRAIRERLAAALAA